MLKECLVHLKPMLALTVIFFLYHVLHQQITMSFLFMLFFFPQCCFSMLIDAAVLYFPVCAVHAEVITALDISLPELLTKNGVFVY